MINKLCRIVDSYDEFRFLTISKQSFISSGKFNFADVLLNKDCCFRLNKFHEYEMPITIDIINEMIKEKCGIKNAEKLEYKNTSTNIQEFTSEDSINVSNMDIIGDNIKKLQIMYVICLEFVVSFFILK